MQTLSVPQGENVSTGAVATADLTGPTPKPRSGFTLVELLVVIGIIAVLISILLPTLSSVQRQARSTACLSALRQFGSFFQLYSGENSGFWPVARHIYPADPNTPDVPANRATGALREKRWHDYLGKYANNGRLVNWDGSSLASPASNINQPNANGVVQDTIASLKARNIRNVLRGCPSYEQGNMTSTRLGAEPSYTVSSSIVSTDGPNSVFVGYSMNPYTFAPLPIDSTTANTIEGRTPWALAVTGTLGNGWYFKQNRWKQPSERALIMDSIHPNTSVTTSVPWWTAFGWTKQAPVPDAVSFTIDFNRHGKRTIGTGYNDKSINMLFCDGSARTVSTREAQRAIRFVSN